MINFQNLSAGATVECRRKIRTDQGFVKIGERGMIVSGRHVRSGRTICTIYRISWPNLEPLDLPAVFTGAGGDLDDPCYSEHKHDDERLLLVHP